MRYLIFSLLCIHTLVASTILSYKVYERDDRVDILFTFDTPYDGRISQQQESDTVTTLLLNDAQYDSSVTRDITSAYLQKLTITPQHDRTALTLALTPQAKYSVSKTVDNYGLRLRFEAKTPLATTLLGTKPEVKTLSNTLPTQKTAPSTNTRYIAVVALLLALVIGLLLFKRKMDAKESSGWLFKGKNPHNLEKVNIIFQKPLDNQNKVVMMEFGHRQYLVIVGHSHLLLDTFSQGESIKDEEGFDALLKRNQHELDAYMRLDHGKKAMEKPDSLQSLKEKASHQAYRTQQEP